MYTKNDIQTAYDEVIERGIFGREDFQIAGDAALVMRNLKKGCNIIVFMTDPQKDGWTKFIRQFPDHMEMPYIELHSPTEAGEKMRTRVIPRIGCLDGMDMTPDLLEGGYLVLSLRCLVRREVARIKEYHRAEPYQGSRTLGELEENLLLMMGLAKSS